jgi:hypothetical protein
LQIIDVSNPANPQRVGGYLTGYSAMGVVVSGNYAYVLGGYGFEVIDVSDPANPHSVGTYRTSSFGGHFHAAISGHYMALSSYGLELIDISNPTDPQQVGLYSAIGPTFGVVLSDHYAYLADFGSFQVLDVSNPANPQPVGQYAESRYTYDVALAGPYAYVVGDSGLDVIDVSNPTNPQRLGGNTRLGTAFSVGLSGDKVVTIGEQGLVVLHSFTPLSGPALQFAPAPRLELNAFHLSVQGLPGLPVQIERSLDLIHWQNWTNGILGTGPLEFLDASDGTSPRQFYRALAP